jgi:lipopolysaccharide biosynthesis regulator YciM
MHGLIRQFSNVQSPGAKDYFLAGNAFLSTHQPAKAIEAFISLEQLNKSKNTHFFEEDSEYYLALGYLANHETSKALLIFERIHTNPNHPYHSAVSSWFLSKLRRANHP